MGEEEAKDVKNRLEELGIPVPEREKSLDIFEFSFWLEKEIKSRIPEVWDFMNSIEAKGLSDIFYFALNRAAYGIIGGVEFYLLANKPDKPNEVQINQITVGPTQEQVIALRQQVAKMKPYAAITLFDTVPAGQFDTKRKKDLEMVLMVLVQTPYWIIVVQIPIESAKKQPRFNMRTLKESADIDVVKPNKVKTVYNIADLLNDSIYKLII